MPVKLRQLVLWLHIGAGFTAFFLAPIAMLTRKDRMTHRRWGEIYLRGTNAEQIVVRR